jgi:hypothetical protein
MKCEYDDEAIFLFLQGMASDMCLLHTSEP